jgi:hypothetical protein
MADVLDDPDAVEAVEEDDQVAEAKKSMMQQINDSKWQVTGRVVGVVKKMVKTYGGSLLCIKDMMPKTT